MTPICARNAGARRRSPRRRHDALNVTNDDRTDDERAVRHLICDIANLSCSFVILLLVARLVSLIINDKGALMSTDASDLNMAGFIGPNIFWQRQFISCHRRHTSQIHAVKFLTR